MIQEINEKTSKTEICENILRSLPTWFGIEDAILEYIEGVREKPMFAFFESDKAVGFISLAMHTEFASEIYVMGITPDFHRSGIGQNLVSVAESYLRRKKIHFFTVKTLSPSREDKSYSKTRKFYLSQGFVPIEEFPTLWGEANPCLFMAKSI